MKNDTLSHEELIDFTKTQREEFDKILLESAKMFDSLLYTRKLSDWMSALRERQEDFVFLLKELTAGKKIIAPPEAKKKQIRKIKNAIDSANKIKNSIKAQYLVQRGKDQEKINGMINEVHARQEEFIKNWQPMVQAAVTRKDWSSAIKILAPIPQYSACPSVVDDGYVVYFKESTRLGKINEEINRWVAATKKLIPEKIYLVEKGNYIRKLLRQDIEHLRHLAEMLEVEMKILGSQPDEKLIQDEKSNDKIHALIQEMREAQFTRCDREKAVSSYEERLRKLDNQTVIENNV